MLPDTVCAVQIPSKLAGFVHNNGNKDQFETMRAVDLMFEEIKGARKTPPVCMQRQVPLQAGAEYLPCLCYGFSAAHARHE